LGLSASPGVSSGKVLLIVLGALSTVMGLLGKRALAVYKATAVILLNTLVLFGIVEAGLLLISRFRDFLPSSPRIGEQPRDLRYVDHGREILPYYLARDWSKRYWQEYNFVEGHLIKYEPYTVWRAAPFRGDTINIGENGLRVTPGASCVEGSLVVFTFGGSTMWGTGVPDWGTLPAYLQEELAAALSRPVCVINQSEQAYVSTQSVIQLLLALRRGAVPDLVVFYSGSNDVFAAYQSSEAGVHQNLSLVAARFESRDEIPPVVRLLSATRTFWSIQRFAGRRGLDSLPFVAGQQRPDTRELATSVARTYLGNYQIVAALAEKFGFDFRFFWQPNLLTDPKSLAVEEASIKEVAVGVYPGLVELFDSTREEIEGALRERANLRNIDRVFEKELSLIYIDPWHVTMEGNQMIARAMMPALATSTYE